MTKLQAIAVCQCIIALTCLQEATSFSWYSTIKEWRDLVSQDGKMLTNIEDIVMKGRSQVNQLLQKIQLYKEISTNHLDALNRRYYSMRVTDEYVSLLRRQVADLDQEFSFNHTMLNIFLKTKSGFPQLNDLNIVLRTLLTLQDKNNLSTNDLANGYIVDTHTGSKLSPNGLYDIANMACAKYTLRQCIEWCEEARRRANESDADYAEEELIELTQGRIHNERFSELCARSLNHTFIEDAASPKLKCFLWDYGHPCLILQPARAEVLSTSPTVVLFYDVITEQQIAHVKKKATYTLGKAQTLDKEKQVDPQNYRVAHNCWLDDFKDKTLTKLNHNLEAITGFSVRRSLEPLQIANYGIGGHYYVHTDAMDLSADEEITHRNRKATFMYYLSDVQYGGATAFVHAGVAIKPVKGAAVFWYNLEWDTGVSDSRTLHGGCPVVLGDKWVANKWIWETSRSICQKSPFG